MEFVVNASIFDRIVQCHPNIDVANIFDPEKEKENDPDEDPETISEKSESSSTTDEPGILYLRIVMGKPIGKVRSIFSSHLYTNYYSTFQSLNLGSSKYRHKSFSMRLKKNILLQNILYKICF